MSPDDFDRREWVALQWIRSYLLFEGVFPDPNLVDEFEHLYPPRERVSVFAVFKLMFFFNMLANTMLQERYAAGAACTIKPVTRKDRDAGESS